MLSVIMPDHPPPYRVGDRVVDRAALNKRQMQIRRVEYFRTITLTLFMVFLYELLNSAFFYFYINYITISAENNRVLGADPKLSVTQAQNYQEIRCQHVFEAMRQCCLKYKPVSAVCEGYSLEPRKFVPASDCPPK